MFVLPVTSSLHRRAVRGAPQTLAHLFADRYCGTTDTSAARSDELRVPAMDVAESDTAYSVTLDMPGATKEQLNAALKEFGQHFTSPSAAGARA